MFSRFSSLAVIRAAEHRRAVQEGCRTHPARFRHHDRTRARFRLEGLEDRCLLSGVSSITEFPLTSPSGYANEGITTGPDGNLWFTDRGSNAIGMINTTTHAISLFSLPTANAWPFGITTGPDGSLWFTEDFGNKIGEINPTTHVITEYSTLPIGWPRGITVGPDGNLWFTSFRGAIGEINPTTHVITEYPTSTNDPIWDIESIAAGSDGNLWFTSAGASYVGQFNPSTDAFSFFATPSGSSARGITAGPDGNLWFTGSGTDQIGVINPATDAISVFALPNANASGFNITAGPDGNLWVTDLGTGSLGTINPSTGTTAEYPIPYVGADPIAITGGPDGNIWFTDYGTNAIGVATLTTSQLVVTQQPPASVTAGNGFGLTVTAEDSSGDPITSFDGTVTVALANNPGGATLGGMLTATASNGVATFSGLTITTADSGYTLGLSASGYGSGVTSAITVTPASATQVAITTEPPSSVTAGTGFSLEAAIADAYGNVETSASNTVSVALASGPTGATLGGTLSVTASDGVATFSGLTLTQAASGDTLQASSSGLSSATSSAITVTPAAATKLVIAQEPPASVTVNSAFGLQATIEDAYGNVETSATSTVKVALDNNPGGAKLGGTASVKASKGVATFSGLTISKTGSGYTLELTSSGVASAITTAINVTTSGDSVTAAATPVTSAPDPLVAPLVLDSQDLLDSLAFKKRAHSIEVQPL